MAATPLSGLNGSVTLPTGFNGRIRAWQATISQTVNDATGFTQQPWAVNLGGIKSLAGTASGYLEFDDTSTAPNGDGIAATAAAMTLTAGTGCTLGFSAVLSNVSYGQSVDGVGTVSFSFVSSGAVTETWDESSA